MRPNAIKSRSFVKIQYARIFFVEPWKNQKKELRKLQAANNIASLRI